MRPFAHLPVRHLPFWTLAVLLASVLPAMSVADPPPVADSPTVNEPHLSLADAQGIADRNSVALKQTRADADAASATARGVQAQTGPSLSATTYATLGDSSNILTSSPGVTPQNIFSVSPRGFADQDVMLMVPLLTGGKLGNGLASARRLGQAARLSISSRRLAVTEAVTEGYADAALQQALVGVAQARLDAEDEQVRVTQGKVQTGRSAPVELLREQAEQADARQALLAAQNGAALALVALKTTLGVSQESRIILSDDLDGLSRVATATPATLQDALQQADATRPELAAAQRRVEAAQSALDAVKGGYAPQVYGVAMADATAGQDVGRAGYTLGLTASLPLYDSGERRADEAGARARLERAQADAQQARQAVDQEAATAFLNFQTATALRVAAAAGVAAAQEGFALAGLRYNAGKGVAAERLDALAALVRAQGSLAQANADLVVARAKFRAALGSR